MTYATVVFDLVEHFPEIQKDLPSYMTLEEMGGYSAFPCLIDRLQLALEDDRPTDVARICSFIERAALWGRKDVDLADLVKIELGEKLGWMEHEDRLAPYLGKETKRICRYVPGLATQRLRLRRERQERSIKSRLLRLFSKVGR